MTPGYLLDTNAIVWLTTAPTRFGDAALRCLTAPAADRAMSAGSAWELAIKVRAGKLPADLPIIADWATVLSDLAATSLDITPADGVVAGSLDWDHRDPFDRLLVAQAIRRGLVLATSDATILRDAPVQTLDTRR